eukprot:TRINITY_DN49929_c0_g1_i1.p1 TRINITY_DN49929_c0_g1~~TRINITY_DN49929_c0_g1_i1.p1  ORF type:complete len:344 (+),score=24.82 TRINITY_DN49929_c0_g1_i1:23-1054(+)
MDAFPHLLTNLSSEWLSFLDPQTMAAFQCVAVRFRQTPANIVRYWKQLFAWKLGLRVADKSCVIDVEIGHSLCEGSSAWLDMFRRTTTTNMRNGLMHSEEEYGSLLGASADDRPPDDIEFGFDAHGRCVRCRLTSRLGSDRCVMASLPFDLESATALPFKMDDRVVWRVSQRSYGYYEVRIGPAPSAAHSRGQIPCVSVGLATNELTAQEMRSQQAGWNDHSWAMHGDDGRIFHGNHSRRFRAFHYIPGVAFRDLEAIRRGRRVLPDQDIRFGEGDIVGCGVAVVCTNIAGLFYTINGRLLGMDSLLRWRPNLRLYPCVGIDAHWTLEFNFGTRPFAFDIDSL